MKVVELYIMRRALAIFAATLLWVLAIVWTTQVLARINIVTSDGQSAATFFEMAFLVLPAAIPVVMPFAIGIGVAQTLSTMNADSEMVVLSASGSSRMTVVKPVVLIAMAACVASFLVHNFVEPYSRERLRWLVAEARSDLLSSVIQEGSFQMIESGLYLQISERLPDGRYGGLFLADRRETDAELIYYAKTARSVKIGNEHILVMEDGVVHRRTVSGDVSIVQYQTYAFDMAEFGNAANSVTLLPKDRTLAFLLNPDPDDRVYKTRPQRFDAELHRRFSEWLYPMVIALIGLAVAGDSRSFREARIHPLITTMTIALTVRWAGYIASDINESTRAVTAVVYAVPLAAMAVSIYFIATNRMMELPSSMADRLMSAWNRNADRMTAMRLSLAARLRPAAGGRP